MEQQIQHKVGKSPDLSLEISECIVQKTLIAKRKAFSLSFRNVTDEQFANLCDYLLECNAVISSDESTSTARLMKCRSEYGDEVTITFYSNRTVMVQGRPLYLYNEVKLFFYVGLNFEEVVKSESATYDVPIETADIRKELQHWLPNAYGFLDEKIRIILTPSICLNKLEIGLEDYSAFVFPALRALEGYIRQLLGCKGKDRCVRFPGKIGSLFDDSDEPKLLDFARNDIGCLKTCDALQRLYLLYKSKRHPYFHMSSRLQTSPVIIRKEIAESHLVEILRSIESTFNTIF